MCIVDIEPSRRILYPFFVEDLFNHENYGTYEVRESNAACGLPMPNPSLVYQPRMLQAGFRATF
jgi:hypothetical protein